ncbi:MAG: hypothetical protein WEF50_23505 [Myxococcota bacterium]
MGTSLRGIWIRHISAALLAWALPHYASAAATLVNPQGTLALGVNDEGHLITAAGGVAVNGGGPAGNETGVAFRFEDGSFYDAASPGCLCEGWGVSVGGTTSGYASLHTDGGANGLELIEFVATESTAVSRVALAGLPGLTIEHAFAPAPNAPDRLFHGRVTIRNQTGAELGDLNYVRLLDWDVPPTEFNERLTIQGVATSSLLARSHNNGQSSANPLTPSEPIDLASLDVDFQDLISTSVPPNSDQGAYFRFEFGSLGAGEELSFDLFYGAAASEALALEAIALEHVELYSLGQSFVDAENGTPATFIFAFAGVGGVPVPEPSAAALVAAGAALLAGARQMVPRLSSRRTSRSTQASTSSSCVGSTRSGAAGTS